MQGIPLWFARTDVLDEDQRPPARQMDHRGDIPEIPGIMSVQQLHTPLSELVEEAQRRKQIQVAGWPERNGGQTKPPRLSLEW